MKVHFNRTKQIEWAEAYVGLMQRKPIHLFQGFDLVFCCNGSKIENNT